MRRVFAGGVVATQLACAGWALGSAYARRRKHLEASEPLTTAPAFEMLFGGSVLLGCSLVLGERIESIADGAIGSRCRLSDCLRLNHRVFVVPVCAATSSGRDRVAVCVRQYRDCGDPGNSRSGGTVQLADRGGRCRGASGNRSGKRAQQLRCGLTVRPMSDCRFNLAIESAI